MIISGNPSLFFFQIMNKSYNIISWNSSWFKFYTFIMYHGRHIVRHCWVIWIMGMHCYWKGGSDQQDCCWCPGANRRRVINQHDDVIKWKHFPRYWPFVRGIHPYPVDSSQKIQWCRAFMFSLICAWTKGLSKQSRRRWFETPSCSLWRHRNDMQQPPCWLL